MAFYGPLPYPAALFDSGWVDQLRDEVAAEGSPERAVFGGVDSAFADAEDEADGGVGRAAGE